MTAQLPYHLGYRAAFDWESADANPYPAGTVAAHSWAEGHHDAWHDAHAALRMVCGARPVVIAQFDADQQAALRRSNHA